MQKDSRFSYLKIDISAHLYFLPFSFSTTEDIVSSSRQFTCVKSCFVTKKKHNGLLYDALKT